MYIYVHMDCLAHTIDYTICTAVSVCVGYNHLLICCTVHVVVYTMYPMLAIMYFFVVQYMTCSLHYIAYICGLCRVVHTIRIGNHVLLRATVHAV